MFQFASLLLVLPCPGDVQDEFHSARQTASKTIDAIAGALTQTSLKVWEHAELALGEKLSSLALQHHLRTEGFDMQVGVSGMPTAFIATFGSGSPVIAFLAEYDALPGLSQTVSAKPEPVQAGAGGHGCGHNLFGAASVGAAIAMKRAMDAHGLAGTVRLYGTPAEEQGLGKVFLIRDGAFDDVDVCLAWHPSDVNRVSIQPSKALRSFEVTFYGRSAHAAGAPWEGVSALDAAEAFTTGVNLLREHMPETARVHYMVSNGGAAPNIVPSQASLWLFTRGKDWQEQERVYRHIERIVEGADLMSWGEEHGDPGAGFRPAEIKMFTGLYHMNVNHEASRVLQRNLERIGAPKFSESEHEFARELQAAFGVEAVGMSRAVVPYDPNPAPESGGSTDVANVSWVTPTASLEMANWPAGVPAHSWASTAASGSSGAQRAMLEAARVLAATGLELLADPGACAAIRAEFDVSRASFDYKSPVGPSDKPTLPSNMR